MRSNSWNKLWVISVAIAFLASLSACGGNHVPSSKPTTANNLKPVTFTFFSEDSNPDWNDMKDEVGKAITEKTGVVLKAQFAKGDPGKAVGLIAASGRYPDLISPKGDLNKLVDAGAMIDLTLLIDKYGPHIKKVYGKYMKRLQYSNSDHAIYVLPTYSGVGQQYFDAGSGFELQHAVVKELGYPRIRTVNDFENAIKAYIANHPTINGKKTIGLSLNSDGWLMSISVTNPAMYATGVHDDGEYVIDPKTYEATYHYLRPVEKKYFKWLNHMNAIGLLDPETFVQKSAQYNAKIASGRVLGLIDTNWDFGSGADALKKAGMYNRGYGFYPVTLSTKYKDPSYQSSGYQAGWGIGITKSCKDPVRAIKFLDFLASDEGQILINWGLKGKDYQIVGGKRVIPKNVSNRKVNDKENFTKESGIGLYVLIGPHYGDGVKDPTGNYYTTNFPQQIIDSYNPVEKDVLSHYHAKTWKDLFPPSSDFPVRPWGQAWSINIPDSSGLPALANKMKEITWSYIPKAILAKPDQFDQVWAEYMQKLKAAGVDKMDQLETKFVKERVELWNN